MNLRKIILPVSIIMLSLCAVFVACGLQNAGNDQWPIFRGPMSSGIASSAPSLKLWNEGQAPATLWKRPLKDAFSGLTLSGKMIVTGFGEDSTEFLGAFDRETGKEIWRYKMNRIFVEEFGNGSRATPAVDGRHAYMFDSWGVMHGVDLATGQGLWTNDLAGTFTLQSAQGRGFCASPILLDGVLVQYVSGLDSTAFMGLDTETGKILWRKGSSVPTFSSPTYTELLGEKQAVFSVTRVITEDGRRKGVYETVSLNAKGETLWTGPGLPGIITMPIRLDNNKIFVASQGRWGSVAMSVTKENGQYKVEEAWKSRNMRTHFNNAVYHKGHIYGFSNATLECLDAESGERKWRQRGLGKGSLIVVGDKLLVLGDKGDLFVLEATPDQYTELAMFQALEGKSWTTPTFADGKLYVRNLEEMACYDLTE